MEGAKTQFVDVTLDLTEFPEHLAKEVDPENDYQEADYYLHADSKGSKEIISLENNLLNPSEKENLCHKILVKVVDLMEDKRGGTMALLAVRRNLDVSGSVGNVHFELKVGNSPRKKRKGNRKKSYTSQNKIAKSIG